MVVGNAWVPGGGKTRLAVGISHIKRALLEYEVFAAGIDRLPKRGRKLSRTNEQLRVFAGKQANRVFSRCDFSHGGMFRQCGRVKFEKEQKLMVGLVCEGVDEGLVGHVGENAP